MSFPTLPETPSLLSDEWAEAAPPDLVSRALKRLSLEVQPDVLEHPMRKKALYARLRKREYTKGEIVHAVDRLADDPELDDKMRYGGDLSAADFRRVIEPIRTTRGRLLADTLLTEREMWSAVEAVPGLDRSDFGACRPEDEDRRYVLRSDVREHINEPTSS